MLCDGLSICFHVSPAITLSTYAHEFAEAEHADRTRERMERAFGGLIG